ncbi:p43 [Artaxa digramma nucleopolyhedrovirus]|uniref:P43 n=1 Tax=Artaxa digramma nucleopolyhedrovirus TaxID=3070910 RepID=A0AAE6V0J3_9ABAC|nr:p43 [Euproctis digramma nucleopolyhedrovirus]QHB21789.1 p43 [Artaxa digramma nucleopolyhedrovirus]
MELAVNLNTYNFDDKQRKEQGILFNKLFFKKVQQHRRMLGLRETLPRSAKSHTGFLFYHVPAIDREERLAGKRKKRILKNYFSLISKKNYIVVNDFKKVTTALNGASCAKRCLTAFIDLCLPNKWRCKSNVYVLIKMVDFYSNLRSNVDNNWSETPKIFQWMAYTEKQTSFSELILWIVFRVYKRLTYSNVNLHELHSFVVCVSNIFTIQMSNDKKHGNECLIKFYDLIFKNFANNNGNKCVASFKQKLYANVILYLFRNFVSLVRTNMCLLIEIGLLAEKYNLCDIKKMYRITFDAIIKQSKKCLSLRNLVLLQHLMKMVPLYKSFESFDLNLDFDFDQQIAVENINPIVYYNAVHRYKYSGWNENTLNYEYFNTFLTEGHYVISNKKDKYDLKIMIPSIKVYKKREIIDVLFCCD